MTTQTQATTQTAPVDAHMIPWSREDAIKAGDLHDISGPARAAGFSLPVAATDELYLSFIKGRGAAATRRRADHFCAQMATAVQGHSKPRDAVEFLATTFDGKATEWVTVRCERGDHAETVLTVSCSIEEED